MITKKDIAGLITKNKLFQMEVDDRHMAIINEVYALGINQGVANAKEAIVWRINGEMWSNFIDEGVSNASTKTA